MGVEADSTSKRGATHGAVGCGDGGLCIEDGSRSDGIKGRLTSAVQLDTQGAAQELAFGRAKRDQQWVDKSRTNQEAATELSIEVIGAETGNNREENR